MEQLRQTRPYWAFVLPCACVRVCVHTQMRARAHTHTHTHERTHAHVCTNSHTHMRARACARAYAHTHTCIHAQTYTHTHTHTSVANRTHTHTHKHTSVADTVHTHTHTHTHIHTHKHTSVADTVHTHAHTHSLSLLLLLFLFSPRPKACISLLYIAPSAAVVDRFYVALFSALEQTYCARICFYHDDVELTVFECRVDILGTDCDQCVSVVECCFTSTETVRLIRTGSPGRPPRLSHSSWTLMCFYMSEQLFIALYIYIYFFFFFAFLFIYQSRVLTVLAWLVPQGTAAVSTRFCVHHTTMHHVTSRKATYVRCVRV